VCVCIYIYIRCGHCVNVAILFIAKRIGSLNECCLLLFNWFWLLQYSYVGQVSVYMSNWVEVLTHTSCWLCLVVLLPEVDVWEANWVWKFCALKYSTVLFFFLHCKFTICNVDFMSSKVRLPLFEAICIVPGCLILIHHLSWWMFQGLISFSGNRMPSWLS
jgi:hypothetical protein